ncbi:hypothetical protein [Zunongwangia sp. H14]|uniref:hypothetical protein n=1 Tax=Zunongwangia sp. H14 TaxID=3240792 RepID=UPI003568A38B
MKPLYLLFGILTIVNFTACTPQFQSEMEEAIRQAENTYFISPYGNDSNTGHSPEDAWKSIEKLNSIDLQPGSVVLFEGGEEFEGSIILDYKDANDPSNPIQITAYGQGRAMIKAGKDFGLNAYNTSGVLIDNLIFQGSGMYTNSHSGIQFYNDLNGDVKLGRIEVTNCEVFGFRNFGIVIGAYNGNAGFKDVIIENNKVHDILDVGISSYGYFSASKSGYAHSNINVRNCEVYNIPGYDKPKHSGNGIVLADVQHSVIEYSTVYNCGSGNTSCGGPVGIWYWDADQVTIQHCEAYKISSGTGCDGGGFDLDGGVTNGIMQYNYSHDNDGGGYLVGQFNGARPMKNIIVRYNISQNDAATNGGSTYLFNGGSSAGMRDIYIYNNTFYIAEQSHNTEVAAIKFNSWKPIKENVQIMNNILYTSGSASLVSIPGGYSAKFQGNLYYAEDQYSIKYQGNSYHSLEEFRNTGNELEDGQPTGQQADPYLVNPGAGRVIGFGNQLTSLNAYKLESGSPAINAGVKLPVDEGSYDFFGNSLIQNDGEDIGAYTHFEAGKVASR